VVLAVAAVGSGVGVLAVRARPATPNAAGPEVRRPVSDRDALQGTWRVVAAEYLGQRVDRLNGCRLLSGWDEEKRPADSSTKPGTSQLLLNLER
jgi:hypothetical protein